MKTPFILTAIILTTAAVIGWRNHQRFQAVRIAHDRVVEEAFKRGISPDSSTVTENVRGIKRAREDRKASAKLLATSYIAFAKEKEALRRKSKEPDADFQKRDLELQERMKSLDPSQWKVVIHEVCSCTELQDGTRQAFLYNSITVFAYSHPEAALAFLAEAPDLFRSTGKAKHLISTALIGWSKNDPLAAMGWIRKNGPVYPDLVTEDTKRQMVTTAAFQDPQIAFTLILGLEINDQRAVIGDLMSSALTPEQQRSSIAGLRSYLETIEDEKERAVTGTAAILSLAHRVYGEGFDRASEWLASADLTPEELRRFSMSLPGPIKTEETARWIEWSSKTYPIEQADSIIQRLVSAWTTLDYQAAGKWLAAASDGPAKFSAVRAYAETVAKTDPQVATQWALTLPAGNEREETLRKIRAATPPQTEPE